MKMYFAYFAKKKRLENYIETVRKWNGKKTTMTIVTGHEFQLKKKHHRRIIISKTIRVDYSGTLFV